MISRRNLAVLSLGGVVLTALLAFIGQTDPNPELDPFQLTVSDYAVMDRGGATDTAMVLFGGSALAALRIRSDLVLKVSAAVSGVFMGLMLISSTIGRPSANRARRTAPVAV